MATLFKSGKQDRSSRHQQHEKQRASESAKQSGVPATNRQVMPVADIAPDDPLTLYLLGAHGAVELDKLNLTSPALSSMRAAGVKVAIPLISQGELVGLLCLGPRLSQQDYSTYDRKLLNDLASQAAPAVRVAQLVQEQQAQARERERIDQELRIARLIQQTLLPKNVPNLPGWQLAAYYQPARAVGGDFYDFLYYDDGRLGIVVGDVTDKGVPAALVMATTRSILRSSAEKLMTPGAVLEQSNNLLCPDIPPKMFVTCLYGILEPETGRLQYANAGHDLPYHRHGNQVEEMRATGMPLGLMPDMHYEEKETFLAPGDSILLYSDGLVEAHNADREMFSFPRLMQLVGESGGGTELIDFLLAQLATFTGPGWEQEDDVTLVALQRCEDGSIRSGSRSADTQATDMSTKIPNQSTPEDPGSNEGWQELDSFHVESKIGNERSVISRVTTAVSPLEIPERRLERLKTAVGEAAMNAMEHGNHYQADIPIEVEVLASPTDVAVRISDQGGAPANFDPETPDLAAKLAGEQSPRGWGLYLIKNLVDEMRVTADGDHHTVELIVKR
jgi:serine phosphatase RsbU (regulator of sigma subunit)/anti-sigma regulatory factor (Ser/Thr protein kinase)